MTKLLRQPSEPFVAQYGEPIVEHILIFLAFLMTISAPVMAQDFQKGVAAYTAGDYATAIQEWTPLAEAGDSSAQTNLGFIYNKGDGVPQDFKEAAKWFRLAAEQGYAEAVKWYRLAADQGVAQAQNNLGFMYKNGQGVPQDYAEAAKWYRLAADQGHASAQSTLGVMYSQGKGVPQDYAEAVKWYRLAADQGVLQDYAEAVKWYRLAGD